MRKYLGVLLLTIGLVFASCGGDDITLPVEPGFNIAQMLGKKEGVVKMSLLPGTNKIETQIAEVIVFQLEGTKNSLQFSFSKPEVIVGGASAANFKVVDEKCQFALGKYTPNITVLKDDKIPAYIKEWFPQNNIVKIEIGEVICEKEAVFDIENGTMSMTYNARISIYDAEGIDPIVGFAIEFAYIGLKNI